VRRLLLLVLPFLLALAACADAEDGGAGLSAGTIRGTVLRGPTCPVETISDPCPDVAAAGVEVQVLLGETVVASAVADADGAFEVDLAAGSYLVRAVPEHEGVGTAAGATRVTVTAGGVAEVTVLLDTGIRAPLE
jgi:hypothetical protein